MRTNIKKALAVLLTLVMLCGLLPLGALTASAATPVLNLNFNDGSAGSFSNASAVQEGPDGSYCLKWTAAGGYSVTYRNVSGVYRDMTFVITFKAKASVAGTMGITIQDGSWQNVYYTETFQTTTSWKEYSITTNVGQNPTSGGSILFKFQDQGTAMDLWVDDLVMVEYEEPAPEVPENPDASENLVNNGSFENSNNGWSLNSNASIVSGGQDGSYALQMKNPTTQYAAIAVQYVDVEPGTGYTLSWWSKRTAGTGIFNLYLDGATKTAGGNAWMSETSGQWVQTVMDIRTNDSTTSLMLKFSNEQPNTNGTILIDNVVLTKHPEASFDGHLYNGDFEIGSLINWTPYGQTVIAAEAAHSGSYGAKLVNPAGVENWNGVLYQNSVGVEAGKTYTVSMWLKAVQQGVNIQVKDGGTSGANLASKWFTTTSWTKLEWVVTPSTNVLCLNFSGGGTGSQEIVYLDDVSITEEKNPSFDGYITNGDMETGKVYPWAVYQSTAVSTGAAYEGNFGLNMNGSGKNYGGLAYQTVTTLKTGKEYTISMWLKVVKDGVNVQVLNGSTNGDKLAYHYYDTNNTGSWKQITLTFTAISNTIVLNFCGSGNDVANEIYVDNVKCERVGGEVYPENLIKFGGSSVRDADVSSTGGTGYGLAFKFDVAAIDGAKTYLNEYVESSASIVLDDKAYTLVRMGAVMTNQASVGSNSANFTLDSVNNGKVINIPAVYLCGMNTESISFAVRVLDIPDRHKGTEVYARPYYVYLENGTETVIYGDIKSGTYDNVSNPKSSIKILSIGHSFSKDVMETYLWNMFKQGGYDEVIIGYLYMGGCSMPKHLYNIQHNLAQYEYGKNSNGQWVKQHNTSALTALQDEEWDYVTIQSSPDYIGGQIIESFSLGVDSKGDKIQNVNMTEYECIDPITDWIFDNATNTSVKIDYHMIWSFSEDCELWSYAYHNKNQITMYNNIIAMTNQYVKNHDAIREVIPSATSIQNGRTSFIGDNFNEPVVPGTQADGYHLNSRYGDYTGALTWYCHFSGDDANVMSVYKGQLTDDEFAAIAEAVNNAIDTPYEITESTY